MTDEAALLAAIAAAPGDETAVLVYADWLDDHDQPDRAAWVRHPLVRPWIGPGFENPIPTLLAALAAGSRTAAARKAVATVGATAVPGLIGLLKNGTTPAARAEAARCLGALKKLAADAVPALLEALSDPAVEVRRRAGTALKAIGPGRDTPTDRLRAALADEDHETRRSAAVLIGKMKATEAMLAQLAAELAGGTSEERRAAADALGTLGTPAAVTLLARVVTADPDPAVKSLAAERFYWLTRVGHVPVLRVALADTVRAVRLAALLALHRLRAAARDAIPEVVALARGPIPLDRRESLLVLGAISNGDPTALGAVVAAVDDAELDVAATAVLVLAAWGPLPPDVLAALLRFDARMPADDMVGRAYLFTALARLDPPPAAVDVLRAALRTETVGYHAVAPAFRFFGPWAAPLVPDVLALAAERGYPRLAADTLARIGDAGLAGLRRWVADGPDAAREAAAAALRAAE